MSYMVLASNNRRPNAWRALPLAVGIGLLMAGTVSSAQAQSTGIAACDDFLTKWDTCITSKLPAAQRGAYQAQIDQSRKLWLDAAKNPATKATVEATCKQTSDAMKTALQGLGCSF